MIFRFLIFIVVLFILSLTVDAYKNILFSTKFADEEYNFAIGRYLTKGEILYEDIITNHQPVTHLLSGLFQKRTGPSTTFDLIKDQRTAVINWSTIWSIIFVLYFGFTGFIFALIYELTRSHFYGNLFLAETFVGYPLAFLCGLALFKKQLKTLELFLAGILLAFLTLALGPIWPALLFLTLLFLLKQFKSAQATQMNITFRKSLILGILGALLVFLLVLPYVNIAGYFRYYIFGNLEGMVPRSLEYWMNSLPKSFLTPFLLFKDGEPSDYLMLVRTLSISLLLSFCYLILKRRFSLIVVIFILLGLLNIRFVFPSESHASGFHLLPWYSAFVFITVALCVEQFKNKSPYLFKGLSMGILILALFFSYKYADSNIFIEKDSKRDYEVFFSTHTKVGENIRNLKKDGDTLFVFPDAWLVYWQSEIDHLPKHFGYYTWMVGIPELKQAVNQAFTNSPPKFFYCEGCKGVDLHKYLEKYTEPKGFEGSQLFVLP